MKGRGDGGGHSGGRGGGRGGGPGDEDEEEEEEAAGGGTSVSLADLDACFAGGNEAFASFLADEDVGVPRHVWLALPIDARYQAPAAELYARRLDAFMAGEALPTDMQVPTKASSVTASVTASPSSSSFVNAPVAGEYAPRAAGGSTSLIM